MWKRGGRSSALDRAQALLSAQRSSRGDAESLRPTAQTRLLTDAVAESVKSGSAPLNVHTLCSDLSELSSVSSAPDAAAGNIQQRQGDSAMDHRPQSSLGGGGSRFLKKPPAPASNSSQSPVNKSQMPQPRYVSSQTAALSRLAQIESHFQNRKQVHEQPRQGSEAAETLTPELRNSPPQVTQSPEPHGQLSAQSSNDQSLNGKRFLKKSRAGAVGNSNTAAAAPKDPDVGFRTRSRAANAGVSSAALETKPVKVVSAVSLESDEEDMKKLLGDSLDSTDNSLVIPGRTSLRRTADKTLNKSSQRIRSTPPAAAVPPSSSSNTAPPRSPASPPHHRSPFRFTGQAQTRFSPSVLSPSPSPPRVSLSPARRLSSPHRTGSPQHSLSSMSGRSEVLSLDELFPVGRGSEDLHSEISASSSEDFKINVMTLDDLVPANLGFTEETPRRETKAAASGSANRTQLSKLKEEETEDEQQQEEEDVLDYRSDFESESRTEPDRSASHVSEHLQGRGDDQEVLSEAPDSEVSRGRTEDDYSSSFSEKSPSYTSQTSDHSQTFSRSRDSRSSVSRGSRTSSRRLKDDTSIRKTFKEAAAQTDPLASTRPPGMVTLGPAVIPSVVSHTLSAEKVEALSTFDPAAFAFIEVLKQQLAMIRRFIDSSRHLHSSLVQSLEPPNYRYATLKDTKEYIRKHRPPKLTTEEVLQEMRD